MKRFVWRLQRLLDVKTRQEDVKRSELVAVTEKALAVKGRIMLEKSELRRMLNELNRQNGPDRLAQQRLCLQYTHVFDRRIAELQTRLVELENLRKEKIAEILEIRKLRKGLEKLREKAKTEFLQQQNKLEQNEADDNTSIRFARALLQQT